MRREMERYLLDLHADRRLRKINIPGLSDR